MLCSRLVCEVNDNEIQRLLLLESELTLDRARKVACTHELAARDAELLQAQQRVDTDVSVNRVSATKSKTKISKRGRKCYRCGEILQVSTYT